MKGKLFSNIRTENIVKIGDHQCYVTFSNATDLTCQLQVSQQVTLNRPLPVSLTVIGVGDAIVTVTDEHDRYFTFKLAVQNVNPSSGSFAGGTKLTLHGAGLNLQSIEVKIGDRNCKILSKSYQELTCDTPSYPMDINSKVYDITYCDTLITDAWGQCVHKSIGFQYHYSNLKTPMVMDIYPKEISSINTAINISVTHISGYKTENISVSLESNSGRSYECQVDSKQSDLNFDPSFLICYMQSVPGGLYNVKLNHRVLGLAINENNKVTSLERFDSVTPNTGSVHGGVMVTIVGFGFPDDEDGVSVQFGDQRCQDINLKSSEGQITCTTPAHAAGVVDVSIEGGAFTTKTYTYDQSKSLNIASISPQNGVSGDILTVSGDFLDDSTVAVMVGPKGCSITERSQQALKCALPDLSGNSYPVTVKSMQYGIARSNSLFMYNLKLSTVEPLEGGYGGGLLLKISGSSFGGNTIVSVCGQLCVVRSFRNDSINCVLPPQDFREADLSCDVNVTNADQVRIFTSKFVYKADLTPQITNVEPHRGGTGGGVAVSITGFQFATELNKVDVRINDIICVVQSVAADTISCLTGPSSKTNMNSRIEIHCDGKGVAVSNNDKDKFEYVDVWSSPYTWGGKPPPGEGMYFGNYCQ